MTKNFGDEDDRFKLQFGFVCGNGVGYGQVVRGGKVRTKDGKQENGDNNKGRGSHL